VLEEEDELGPPCFGPRIRDEPFPKGFTLPRDTPKYTGSMKPEDWLVDYSTTVSIANSNKRVTVKYVPLMLQGTARTWPNNLKSRSINSWVNFTEAFVRNFTSTYKRPPKPRQLSLCVQGPSESTRDYLTRWAELRNSCEGVHEVQAIEYFTAGCREGTLLKHKLLCDEPETLDELLITADKYATVDSSMKARFGSAQLAKSPLRLQELRLGTPVGGNNRTTTSTRPRSRLPAAGRSRPLKPSSQKSSLLPSDRKAASRTGCRPSPTSRLLMDLASSIAAQSRQITPPGSATGSPGSPRETASCLPRLLGSRLRLRPSSRLLGQSAQYKTNTLKSMEPMWCSPVWLMIDAAGSYGDKR